MSLDVTLYGKTTLRHGGIGAIFVRENGKTREISRQEWDEKFPNQEPVVMIQGESNAVFSTNITHNLNTMAEAAGIYEYLWRPEEVYAKVGQDLIAPLTEGLAKLRAEPEKFRQYNPPNGWGDYEGLVQFVEEYLEACKNNPEATIEVSR